MEKTEIYARICDTLRTSFEVPEERLRPEARLMEDLELDSIDAIDLAVQIQEMTNVRVAEQELKDLRTVQDMVELVAALLSRGG